MTKLISKAQIIDIESKLAIMEKPSKEKFTRQEAVKAWRHIIQTLVEKGWGFQEIVTAIKEASNGEIHYRAKELEELYLKQTQPLKGVRRNRKQPKCDQDIRQAANIEAEKISPN